jgi:uncharacterized protein YacL
MKEKMRALINHNTFKKVVRAGYFSLFVGLLTALPVYAYIDPGTTAIITQIVAGIFISLGVAFGVFRQKIFIFFKNLQVKAIKRKIEKQAKKDESK